MVRRQRQNRQSGAEAATDSEGQQEEPGRAHLRDFRGKIQSPVYPGLKHKRRLNRLILSPFIRRGN